MMEHDEGNGSMALSFLFWFGLVFYGSLALLILGVL